MRAIVIRNLRRWRLVATLAMVAWATLSGVVAAQPIGRLLPREHVARLGLTRAWFAQVQLDASRSHVERAILSGDQLFVLTSAGTLHAFHAETGETLWVSPFGDPKHPCLGPAANDQFVALVNGSTLFVLDRVDGRPVIVRPIGGVPGASPAMSSEYCFVPMVTGRIEGLPVRNKELAPWYYQSYGRVMVPPLATDSSIVWSTDIGYVYVGHATEPGVRFRLETASEIVAQAAFRRPFIFAATIRGEVIAVHETSGARRWKFAAGFPIFRAPAAVGTRVFVTSAKPALCAVDAATGDPLWEAAKVVQFAAASEARVYGIDVFGALSVLDAATGAALGRMATNGAADALVNDQTDRIYLVSKDGLVQCLHELGADKPLYHNPPEVKPAGEVAPETGPVGPAPREPGTPRTSPAAENPFGAVPPATKGESPFGSAGAGGTAPAGAAPPAGQTPPGGAAGGAENPFEFDR